MALPVPLMFVGRAEMTETEPAGLMAVPELNAVRLCEHGLPLQEWKCRRGPNKGRVFLCCPKRREQQCGVFMWENEATVSTCHVNIGRPLNQANSALGEQSAPAEVPSVMGEVKNGKLVLSLDASPLAEVRVHATTHQLECVVLTPPKSWVGGKVGQKSHLAEAKRKMAELADKVDDSRAEAAAKVVKELKRAAREKGVGLTSDPAAPIRNAQVGKLMVLASEAIRSAYLPAYMAYKAEKKPSTADSAPASALSSDVQVQMMLDSGTNTGLGSRRAAKAKGVAVNDKARFSVTGIENQPRVTDGQSVSPLTYEMVDTNGVSGHFSFHGQIMDMNDSERKHKFLLDVVNDMVGRQGYEVVFRKNKIGGMGHFVRRPGSAQLFPVHLNDEKLPVLPIKGFKSTFQSVPDTLEEYAAEMLESCSRPDAGQMNAVSREVERQLGLALQEAQGSSSSSESDSWDDEGSGWESVPGRHAKAHARNRAAKNRRKASRALLGRSDIHRILHRGKRQTYMTFAKSCVQVADAEGKAMTGDRLVEADFEEACDTCALTRMKAAPTNRSGKIHAAAGSSSE